MSPSPTADEELQSLRAQLDDIEGIETSAGRPGTAAEGGFQGHVAMRVDGQAAVERLLARLGDPFWAVFHVGEQKCELGFRVEVTTSQDALRYDLRFWGCPEPPSNRPSKQRRPSEPPFSPNARCVLGRRHPRQFVPEPRE
ncbi:MAG: hypothetical protein BRD32_04480 [Bacteroidetes bacterium QH_2_64_74]|nr:MAG: hypothetical protein BRD32_04480 [Bacteroidetes bacterium QH_2_64_74]